MINFSSNKKNFKEYQKEIIKQIYFKELFKTFETKEET